MLISHSSLFSYSLFWLVHVKNYEKMKFDSNLLTFKAQEVKENEWIIEIIFCQASSIVIPFYLSKAQII